MEWDQIFLPSRPLAETAVRDTVVFLAITVMMRIVGQREDGGGPAKGGDVRLLIDDQQVGEGRVERTQPLPFASDEPLEIGHDQGSSVTPDYTTHVFTGSVGWVEIEIPPGGADNDDDISAEERQRASLTVE